LEKLTLAKALKCLRTGIIISHNHPSEALIPSEADKKLTLQLRKAAGLFGVKVLDHLIVTPQNTYFSFAEEGLL
jgi:DNA repair protein RadC